jgi:hypothetical protein
MVGYLIIREEGWLTGSAIIIFTPVAMISAMKALVMRWRGGYAAAIVWAVGSLVAVLTLDGWGFVVSASAGVLGARVGQWSSQRRSPALADINFR